MSAEVIAQWMADQLKDGKYLYQEVVVYQIIKNWGKEFTYTNANGNPAISKEILKAFKTLTSDQVVWERGERAWRPRREGEQTRGVE